jgi:hypothetical protein
MSETTAYVAPLPGISWYNEVVREGEEQGYGNQRHAPKADVYQPHDKGYKSLLSSKKVFLELLRSFMHQNWVKQIQEENLQRIDKSYVSSDFTGQESDLVYQVTLRDRNRQQKQDVIFYILQLINDAK